MGGGVPKVLILGHSFVKRLYFDLSRDRLPPLNLELDLRDTAEIYFHGIGGRTVAKLRQFDLRTVRRLRPNVVLLEIGTNDLCQDVHPTTVGSDIEDLVQQLITEFGVSVVCVCHVIPRSSQNRDCNAFAAKARSLCQYLDVVIEPIQSSFCWRHTLFTNPYKDLYCDSVHLNARGQKALYRSYRGAILKALKLL